MKITAFLLAPCLAFTLATSALAHDTVPAIVPPAATPQEIEMGKKAMEELEKDPKFKPVDLKIPANKAMADKLTAIAKKLGAASARPLIDYRVTIVEDKELNAFTLPNGQIYFYTGLIDAAGSDDELAAVMAHEIGHNARMHVLRMQKKGSVLNIAGMAAMVAMLLGRNGANVAAMAPYVLTGIASGYQEGYEKEADAAAIPEMIAAGYNPSALVTFMNRMAEEEERRPKVELGIYQTHPASPERAAAAKAEIEKRGLVYSPRAVSGAAQAQVALKDNVATLSWKSLQLLTLHGDDAKARADVTAARLNDLIRNGLKLAEITTTLDDKGAVLKARNIEIVRADNAEAKTQNLTPLALAQKWRTNLSRLFWSEAMNGSL